MPDRAIPAQPVTHPLIPSEYSAQRPIRALDRLQACAGPANPTSPVANQSSSTWFLSMFDNRLTHCPVECQGVRENQKRTHCSSAHIPLNLQHTTVKEGCCGCS